MKKFTTLAAVTAMTVASATAGMAVAQDVESEDPYAETVSQAGGDTGGGLGGGAGLVVGGFAAAALIAFAAGGDSDAVSTHSPAPSAR